MLYLLFGKDEFACEEALKELERGRWSDPSLGDLNRTVLDGRRITIAELRHHCDAIPFLADRRLVIVENLIARVDGKKRSRPQPIASPESSQETEPDNIKSLADGLLAYFPNLPETTDLVLIDPGLEGRNSRVARWARSKGNQAIVKEFSKKRGGELNEWIRKRVNAAGGNIERNAIAALTHSIGDDLRALASEIDKLVLFVDEGKTITVDDVRRLVTHSREANIFHIVDAIGNRDWKTGVTELRGLIQEGAHPLYVLSMIQRQYCLIVQAHALAGERLPPREFSRRLGIHEYPAKKVQAQAKRYTGSQLVEIYDRLLATDLAIKTGQIDGELAIELFITEQTKEGMRSR